MNGCKTIKKRAWITSRMMLATAVLSCLGVASVPARSKTVSIVTLDFPPISDPAKPGNGFIGELFRAIFEPEGYTVDIKVHPWARSFELSKKGEAADGIFPSIYTENRTAWYVFSDPIITSGYVLVTRRDTSIDSYDSLYEFKHMTIGVLRKGVTGSVLDSPDFKKEEGKSFDVNIRKLLKKRFDLITGEYLAITDIIDRQFSNEKNRLVILDPPVSRVDFYFMISKNARNRDEILKSCNRGNLRIKQDGTLDRLKLKHGIRTFGWPARLPGPIQGPAASNSDTRRLQMEMP